MRIAVNTRFLLAGKLEGIGWYTYEVLKRMVRIHPEDEFIFLFDRPYDNRFIFGDNVTPVVIGPPARHPLLWYIWFEWSLPRILKKHKVDVFFSPDGYCSIRSNVPTLMTLHDLAYFHYPQQINYLVRKYYQYFVPRFLKRAQIISTVSHFVKEDIVKNLHISADKIIVVQNGCREDFKPIKKESLEQVRNAYTGGRAFFLYYGAIHPRKNVLNTILAFENFKKISESDICLVLAGRMAWHTSEIEEKLKSSAYNHDIIHLGYIADELSDLVGSAMAVVYISYFEGFGLPVLEAMSAGVPVICSNISSLPEVAWEAAILVDPDNIPEIADALSQVFYNEAIRNEMIVKGLNRAKEFSWDNSASLLYKALKSII